VSTRLEEARLRAHSVQQEPIVLQKLRHALPFLRPVQLVSTLSQELRLAILHFRLYALYVRQVKRPLKVAHRTLNAFYALQARIPLLRRQVYVPR